MALPNRSMKTLALLAALTALMGVVATGCGASDDDAKQDDKTEEPAAEDGATGDEATDGDDAAKDGAEPAVEDADKDA